MPALQRFFLAPPAPNIAAGFADDTFAVVDLRRGRRGFSLVASALTPLPPGLFTIGFDTIEIQNNDELMQIMKQTAEAAGLANKKRWSVALPETAARTLVVSLESRPGSSRELNEVIEWKVERLISARAADLWISRQRMSPWAGQDRYLVTVGHDDVLSRFETVFSSIGWNAGKLLPRHMGEAQWLSWDNATGDKILVSANRVGFTSVIVRNREPVVVRSFACDRGSIPDELHSFALYYRDKFVNGSDGGNTLTRMLVLGEIDAAEARSAIAGAIDSEPVAMDPAEFGLDLRGEPIRFHHIAGAAGLATIAWQ